MDAKHPFQPPEEIALNPAFRENAGDLLHALLQAVDNGILLSGLDRQDIVANKRLGELFAVASSDIVQADPATVRSRIHSRLRDPESFDAVLERTYADPTLSFEDEIEMAGDPPRTLRRFTGPVLDRDRKPIGRLWTFLDITETKRLQAAVQTQLTARTEDYAQTSDVLRAMNDLCRLAVGTRTTEALAAALAERVRLLIGYEAAAVLLCEDGRKPAGTAVLANGSVKTLRLDARRDPALAAVLASGENMPAATPRLYTDEDGPLARQLKCKTVCVAPLRLESRVIGALAMGTREPNPCLDHYRIAHMQAVADQVALTLETHRLQSELHTTLERLQTTQRKMVEMEKLRTAGTLAAAVAHDIRNILTVMEMEVAALPEPASEALAAQINRFSALTHRLLAFSQPGFLETHPVQIADVLGRIVPLVAGQAQINGVEIVVRQSRRIPPVAADAGRLEHLFVNLCLNAIQSMHAAGGTLTLTVHTRKPWLQIAVQDTGGGIAPEVVDRLFDPFFTTRANGFGLGLFSCKRIVEEHGGRLAVTSLPGKGACFTVHLPTIPQEREEE